VTPATNPFPTASTTQKTTKHTLLTSRAALTKPPGTFLAVLSSPSNAVRPFTAPPLRNLLLLCSFSFTFSSPIQATDTSLDDAVQQLAQSVADIPDLRGPLNIQFFQDPAFQAETGKDWQENFKKELQNHHIVVSDDSSANVLRVGLAETPTKLILSSSVRVENAVETRFVAIPRSSFRAASLPVAPIRVERQLVYQSPDRILDASSLWNGSEGGMAILLSKNSDLSLLRVDPSGQLAQTIPLRGAADAPSRDPRGEIASQSSAVTILLPGKACEVNWTTPADAKCHAAKPLWRTPTVLTPSCNAGGWRLLSDSNDWSTPDVLQVIPDGPLRQGSAALLSDFPGPILSINGEQNPASALVVAQNLRTGNYEVYKITLACGK